MKINKENLKVALCMFIPTIIITHLYLAIYILKEFNNIERAILELVIMAIYFSVILFFIICYYNEQINKDFLTEIYNGKKLNTDLDRNIRKNQRFYCIVIDLDGFKSTNDNYGHEAGDKVLIDFAKRMSRIIGVIAYRNGGDEFVLLIKDDGKRNIETTLKEIKKAEAIINIGNRKHKTKFSMGLAHFPEDATTKENLLNLADLGMYESKNEKT